MSTALIHSHAGKLNHFHTSGSELIIGGIPLSRIAQRVGQTPFYAYDRSALIKRVAMLRKHMPQSVHLHYAMKANPMPAVVSLLGGLLDGIDLASTGEMQVALDAGVLPEDISFAGPGKSEQELRQAVAAGILINVESVREVLALSHVSHQLGYPARVAIRVNPDFDLKSSGMKMSGGSKPFGIDAEQVPEVLKTLHSHELVFEGFHIYCGSQNLSSASICEAQVKSYELALRLAEDAPSPVKSLNLGGGFGICYFPNDQPLDLAPIAENMQRLSARAETELPQAKLVLELGRYLVGEAGVYVCEVIDRKVSRGQIYLVTNGGLHHHLAASGNFGQVFRKNYPVLVGNKADKTAVESVNVVGPLCTPLDLLGDKVTLPVAEVGDLIVILQSGAYGLTASPTAFLSHPKPMEILV